MTDQLVARLGSSVGGQVSGRTPLAGYTTLRVGGPAAALVRAETATDLAAVADTCAALDVPWLIVGRGSNLLVSDAGWPGVAVLLGRGFRGVEVDGESLVAGAAEPMPALAQAAASAGLGGLAFGVAIPGTLGGAVRMNAGAHGRELAQILEWVEAARLASGGAVERLDVSDLAMRYRRTGLPADALVMRARLNLQVTDRERLAAEMADMRRWRRQHQPINEPSCGSVFANPPGDSAGRLIEAAGLKGSTVGGARISPVHANFITARRDATAADVYALIARVRDAVERAHGVRLETEVVMAGFDGTARCAVGTHWP